MEPRNEHVYQTGQKAYDLLVEYITADQKKSLTEQLNGLRYTHIENTFFAKEIQQGHWIELFTPEKQAEFPARSLRCLRDGLITTMQYVTSQLFYNVFTHPKNKDKNLKIEKILTPEGKLIKTAMAKIEATMKLVSSSFVAFLHQQKKQKQQTPKKQISIFDKDLTAEGMVDLFFDLFDMKTTEEAAIAGQMDWASEAEKNKFYSLLSKLPASEQCFIILDDPYFDGINLSTETSVIQQINYRIGFNVFSRFRINDKPKIMIPSAGMMQVYLEATRPMTRMPAIYRFGLSPVEGLYQTMKSGGRDKVICTALLPECTPAIADTHSANIAYAEAELHDFYHETLCANIPINDRILLTKFIDKLQSIQNENSNANVRLYAAALREVLIDMEHPSYDRNMKKSLHLKIRSYVYSTDPKHHFWASLNLSDVRALSHFVEKQEVKDVSRLTEIKDECHEVIVPLLTNWLLENEKSFYEQLDLDLTKLMDFSHVFLKAIAVMIQKKMSMAYQDITQGIRIAFQRKSLFMLKMVSKKLSETGDIASLKTEYSNEFAYFMDYFRFTAFADTLMKEMLSDKRNPLRKDILDLFYPKNHLNHVYDSDKRTLVQRALYAEEVELLLRLTNEGASVVEVPGASKPCPLMDAVRTGRYELFVILYYAYEYGAGWQQKFPEVTMRIRRMAMPYQTRFLKAYPEKNEDEQWAMRIIENAKIPYHLFKTVDLNEFQRDVKECQTRMDRFFNPPNPGAGTPITEVESQYMLWAHEGGALPSCKK